MAESNGELAETKSLVTEQEPGDPTTQLDVDSMGESAGTASHSAYEVPHGRPEVQARNEVEEAIDIIGFDGIAEKYGIDRKFCTSEHFYVEYDERDNPWLIPKRIFIPDGFFNNSGVYDVNDQEKVKGEGYNLTREGYVYGDNVSIDPSATIGLGTVIRPGAEVMEHAVVGRFCRVGLSSLIEREAAVGPDTEIDDNTTVRVRASIGRGCKIGNVASILAEVKVMDNVTIGDEVVLHPRVTVGAGSKIAGPKAIIEDGAEIGAKVSIEGSAWVGEGTKVNNGTIIESGVHIGEGVIVGSNSLIKGPGTSLESGVILGEEVVVESGIRVGERVRVSDRSWILSNVSAGKKFRRSESIITDGPYRRVRKAQ